MLGFSLRLLALLLTRFKMFHIFEFNLTGKMNPNLAPFPNHKIVFNPFFFISI